MDQSNAFSSHHYLKTSSIAVDIACKELTKKMLDMASIPVASGSSKRRRFGRDHKKITLNRVKTIGWKSRKELINQY
jgi:hypothetical protein